MSKLLFNLQEVVVGICLDMEDDYTGNKDNEYSDLDRVGFLACLLRNHKQHPNINGNSVVLSSELLRDLNASLFGIEE
ncbi:hypothetical protein ACFLXV_04125 [Chloroflexota bacterium]